MFKSAVVATVLLQASATKIESVDHNTLAINPQMVEAINVSNAFCSRNEDCSFIIQY